MGDAEKRIKDFTSGYLAGLCGMPVAIINIPEVPDTPVNPVNPPVMAPNRSWFRDYYTHHQGDYTKIILVDSYSPVGDEKYVWKADKDESGSIMCYTRENTLYIVGNGSGKIIANEDSDNMFYLFGSLTSIEGLELLDTSNVTSMKGMFFNCVQLSNLNLRSFDTSNVTNMRSMFYGCRDLYTPILTRFDTSNVTDMSMMFLGCDSLISLNLRSFNTTKVRDMSSMFNSSEQLKEITVGPDWVLDKTNTSLMFNNCGVQSVTYSSEPPEAPAIFLGTPSEDAAAYLYGPDQIRLPAWPVWNEVMYPYACMVVKDGEYYFYGNDVPFRIKSGGGLNLPNYNDYTKKLVDGVWEESTGVAIFSTNTVVWANYDMHYATDDTLYMTASKPEAVYEPGNEPGIIVSIDNKAIMLGCRLGYIIRSQMGSGAVATMCLYGTPSESGNIGLRVGDTVTYYDGAVLPKLPEIPSGYFACVLPLNLLGGYYRTYIGPGITYYTGDAGEWFFKINGPAQRYICYPDDTAWKKKGDIEDGSIILNMGSIDYPYWVNRELLNEDGTVGRVPADTISVSGLVGNGYNGEVITAEIPEKVMGYPYVILTKTSTNWYVAYGLDTEPYTEFYENLINSHDRLRLDSGNYCAAEYQIDEWSYVGEEKSVTEWSQGYASWNLKNITWANFDIYASDGSLYSAKSNPVPVYE